VVRLLEKTLEQPRSPTRGVIRIAILHRREDSVKKAETMPLVTGLALLKMAEAEDEGTQTPEM